jgi:hypothetical protein
MKRIERNFKAPQICVNFVNYSLAQGVATHDDTVASKIPPFGQVYHFK